MAALMRVYCPRSLAVESRPAYLRTTHNSFVFFFPTTALIPAIVFIKMGKSTLTGIARFFSFIAERRKKNTSSLEMSFHRPSCLAYDVGVRFMCGAYTIMAGMIDPSRMSVQLGDVMNRPRQRRRLV